MKRKILISGAGGFLGRAIAGELINAGFEVAPLSRKAAPPPGSFFFDPVGGRIDPRAFEGAAGLVNLSGESVFGYWTRSKMSEILSSRLRATSFLAGEILRSAAEGFVLVSASAVGFYGHSRPGPCGEESPRGDGFLAEVCERWEAEAMAASGKARVVNARFGVVLGNDGGMLRKLLPLFRLNLGGRIGGGSQPFSWISAEDAAGAVLHLLGADGVKGPVNLVSPGAETNASFTSALAGALDRKALFPVPSLAVRLAAGRMGEEMLLGGVRAVPGRLLESGFEFSQPDLPRYLRKILS